MNGGRMKREDEQGMEYSEMVRMFLENHKS